MSRRGQRGGPVASTSSQAAHHDSGGDNILQEKDPDKTDSTLSNIRYGMESILKIYQETVPFIPDEDEQEHITTNLEGNFLQLLESELVYMQTSSIVNQVVDELALQDNRDMDAKQFADSVDNIHVLSNQRLQQYKDTLTEEMLRGHPKFLQLKHRMEELLKGDDDKTKGQGVDNADAETEAEEVDLDDSMMDEDDEDEDEHEVIPDLDPISKQPLRDPVRNKLCKHIYGKASMTNLIKKSARTRCPYMGCGNDQFLKISHLQEDPILTAKVLGQPVPPKVAKVTTPSRGKARRGRRRH